MTPSCKATVRALLKDAVEDLLDDPAGAVTSDKGLRATVVSYAELADAIGLDWDSFFKNLGSQFEHERVANLLEEGDL